MKSNLILITAFIIHLTIISVIGGDVTVDHGVGAGRDINANDIIIKYGLTEKDVLAVIDAHQKKNSAAVKELIKLSHKLGVTENALTNFFRIIGENQIPPEKQLEKLAEIAGRHKRLLDQVQSLQADHEEIEAFRAEEIETFRAKASEAIEEGEYGRAEQFLAETENIEIEAAKQMKDAYEKRMLNAAERRAERGDLSMTQLDYSKAALHYQKAYELVPDVHKNDNWGYQQSKAKALYKFGSRKGNRAALEQAIVICQSLLVIVEDPIAWAKTQNILGEALTILGEWNINAKLIEEAVAAHREALKKITRERIPLDWAATQFSLGNALYHLGVVERESSTKPFEEAVAAYQEALKEWTRERAPLEWTKTQNNLGNALAHFGERKASTKLIKEAVAAYQEALKEWTREKEPLSWAGIQNNLGLSLYSLGNLQNDLETLRMAKTCFDNARTVYVETGNAHRVQYFSKKINITTDSINKLIQ
jgi:tetratricopeptide (TPR) repeat protein